MGAYLFRLPDVGEGVAEAEITAWHVKLGDYVREDEPLLDVMTDKTTVDMSSPVEGTIVALHGKVGSKAAVGSVLVELEVVGELPPPSSDANQAHTVASLEAPSLETKPPIGAAPSTWPTSGARVNTDPTASPATRRQAMRLGVNLHDVLGTGRNGIITIEDLQWFLSHAKKPDRTARDQVEEVPIIGLRRRMAERVVESKRQIPHFSYVEEFDLTELEGLRAHLNANRRVGQSKLTLLPFFMRAFVKLVPEFPDMNAHYDQERGVLKRYSAVHIGIATHTPQGLMLPVVHHAETRDVWGCAAELARVTQAARDGSGVREQLSGSTVTLTSLGALGGIAATPIVNPPEVAILGPNKLMERAALEGAFLARRKVLNLSGSFDHRVIGGHDAASFIQRLKQLMEHPALIFMD